LGILVYIPRRASRLRTTASFFRLPAKFLFSLLWTNGSRKLGVTACVRSGAPPSGLNVLNALRRNWFRVR
jgi:hypothetical protein